MNVSIANKLCELRKKHGYSQEELADKLGISRQAVSKWERAEASPDTDNLIELASLYGVSLDELLGIQPITSNKPVRITGEASRIPNNAQRIPSAGEETGPKENSETSDGSTNNNNAGGKRYAFEADIYDDDDEDDEDDDDDEEDDDEDVEKKVVIDENGVFVKKGKKTVFIKNGGVFNIKKGDGKTVNINAKRKKEDTVLIGILQGCYPILVVIAFLLWGFLADAFYVSWTLFVTIPVYYSLVVAIKHKRLSAFAYPVLVTFIFLLVGMIWKCWHPMWVIFLTIPVYYSICGPIDRHFARKHNTDEREEITVTEKIIPDYKYASNLNLVRVHIPRSVVRIGDNAFEDCINLKEIVYEGTKSEWEEISKGDDWDEGCDYYIITCLDGVIKKWND